MNSLSTKVFPAFVVSMGIAWLSYAAMPPRDPADGFELWKFAAIPVQENGRLMPFDTFARTKLMVLNHRQDVVQEIAGGARGDDVETRTVPACEWAINSMLLQKMKNSPIDDMHMFRIDNDQLVAFLDLKKSREFGFHFKLGEFIGNKRFWDRVAEIRDNKGPRKGDILDNKIAELWHKIQIVHGLAGFEVPFLVPPKLDGAKKQEIADVEWYPLASAADDAELSTIDPSFIPISQALLAYSTGDKRGFNRAIDRYTTMLNDNYPDVAARMQTELRFNNFAPFKQCTGLFVCMMLLASKSWMVWHRPLRYAAWGLGILTMIVYTWALYIRVYLSGYAPVTNLYSSAIFIGWGCAGLCLMLELILRNGIGTVVAGVTGTSALIIAHNLLDGDSMGKIVAVLDSNFWLSTHVICITCGYTATFVAGFLAIAYVGLGMFTPMLRKEPGIVLGKVLYGIICFAMLLSFVGTVLGGIWADQSWGRFWGWDPKENGALLIVIWNALILHARWAGLVKTRGMAMLAIFGNAVTAWSWFGTNYLGVGLHAYGFAEGKQLRILFFTLSQLALIGVAAVPQKYWASFCPEKRLPTAE